MKTNTALWTLSVTAVIFASNCSAALNGSDDFNDNSKDPSKWGTDFVLGTVGRLTETNARLEFTTSGIPDHSTLVARPWILNFGTSTQNWEVHYDVSVPQLGFPEALCGLGISLSTNLDPGNIFSIDLFTSTNGGGERVFKIKFAANGSEQWTLAESSTASTYAGLRIAFDASTKVLSAYYDENGPTSGYSWTLLGSTNISTAWSISPATEFGVLVAARVEESSRLVTSADNLFGDNFYATSETPPSLRIISSSGEALLIWPTNAPGYHLESVTNLTSPIEWQDITNTPGIVGTDFAVTNSTSNAKAFYRLIK